MSTLDKVKGSLNKIKDSANTVISSVASTAADLTSQKLTDLQDSANSSMSAARSQYETRLDSNCSYDGVTGGDLPESPYMIDNSAVTGIGILVVLILAIVLAVVFFDKCQGKLARGFGWVSVFLAGVAGLCGAYYTYNMYNSW